MTDQEYQDLVEQQRQKQAANIAAAEQLGKEYKSNNAIPYQEPLQQAEIPNNMVLGRKDMISAQAQQRLQRLKGIINPQQ